MQLKQADLCAQQQHEPLTQVAWNSHLVLQSDTLLTKWSPISDIKDKHLQLTVNAKRYKNEENEVNAWSTFSAMCSWLQNVPVYHPCRAGHMAKSHFGVEGLFPLALWVHIQIWRLRGFVQSS